MQHEASLTAVLIFAAFVVGTLVLSWWLGRRTKDAAGYFAAHGQIPWFVNGVAFAGDYLSAASFLGICGMIAFYGYDGFLYSIGFLAGWVVALFVIAEPMKRLGKFTFADALDAKFNSPGIKVAAGLSTLAVSIFYLIPQMVGAGALVTPLLGLPHWAGVVLVGGVVIAIVVTAGMVSTTWVQFIKGGLLVVFSTILVGCVLWRGFDVPQSRELALAALPNDYDRVMSYADDPTREVPYVEDSSLSAFLLNVQEQDGGDVTGPLDPLEFLRTFSNAAVARPFVGRDHLASVSVWRDNEEYIIRGAVDNGEELLVPGNHPKFAGIHSDDPLDKLNFLSLMLALFCGTASLPHILIRYYTVKDAAAARKSTIVGIAVIGFFYVLTLFIGLGAMTSGALDPTDPNMAAPLLARTFGEWLFACISAVAFTTVLGTVSGLILASAGAVSHDLLTHGFGLPPGRGPAGAGREGRQRGRRRHRHRAGRAVPRDERRLPRRLGLQRGGQREPAGARVTAVLARGDETGGDRRGRHRDGDLAGLDSLIERHLRADLRPARGRRADPVHAAGDRNDPAGVRGADRSIPPHAPAYRTRRRLAATAGSAPCGRGY